MKLLLLATEEEFEAKVVEVEPKDYDSIKKSGQFVFDWLQEKKNHVFKIVKVDEKNTSKIHGLISLQNISEEFRIRTDLKFFS